MFIPLDDLSDKTEAQRQEYYLEACEYFGVPPELNVLKWFWDDSKQGKRALILYATRGATDIIRSNHDISVVSLDQTPGPGYVIFTATGQNAKGRIERAVGVAHLEGLRGAKFENAIKKAQTESLRRMTLQFAGGGLIDESELPNYDSTVPADIAFKAIGTPIPASQNNTPGTIVAPVASNDPVVVAVETKELKPEDYTVGLTKAAPEVQEAFEKQQADIRKEAIAQLDAKSAAKAEESVAEAPKVEAPKKKRKSKNSKSMDGSEVENSVPSVEKAPVSEPIVEKQPEPPQPQVVEQKIVTPAPATSAPVEGAPTPEQLKDYRARLGKYANEILPTAGMLPTAGIGGVTMKLRAFAQLQIGVEVTKATAEQWDDLFSFLDDYTANKGAGELVKYIDAALVK